VPVHLTSDGRPTIDPVNVSTAPGTDPVVVVAAFLAIEGQGLLVLVGAAAIWPLVALLVVVARRRPWQAPWRPFAWAASAAAGFSLLAGGYAFYLLETNGTSRAMASLGPQIAAGLALVGSVVSAVIAIVLRAVAARSGTPPAGSADRPGEGGELDEFRERRLRGGR
jgi:hypothetical protein